jgi:hypothetical protein
MKLGNHYQAASQNPHLKENRTSCSEVPQLAPNDAPEETNEYFIPLTGTMFLFHLNNQRPLE